MLMGFTSHGSLKRSRVYRAGPTAKEYAHGDNKIEVSSSSEAETMYDYDEDNDTGADTFEAGIALSAFIASKGGGQTEVIFCVVAREFETVLLAMMAANLMAAKQAIAKVMPERSAPALRLVE